MGTPPPLGPIYDRLNRKHFAGALPKLPLSWSGRMTASAGIVYFKGRVPKYITMSRPIFAHEGYKMADIERTLAHEMVHVALVMHRGDNTHGPAFQKWMTHITGEHKNHRCHNYAGAQRRRQRHKWKFHCKACGTEGTKARDPKAGRYRCGKCKAPITFTRNR